MTPLLLLAIVALVLVNGFFVAAEFALVSVRPERLDGSRAGKLVARQAAKLDEYLSACQLGITIASLALGALGEPTIARLLEPALGVFADFGAVVATLLALLIMTALHITAGEQAPKSFAIGSAERVAGLCAFPLEVFYVSLRPLVRVLNSASNAIVRLFGGMPASSHGDQASLEELRQLIRAASETGQIDRSDSQLLRGVFTLDERTASDVMTPRHRLTTVVTGQSIEEALRSTSRSRHSRFPLLEADDELHGLVISREMTDELLDGRGGLPIESVRHAIVVAPATQALDVLLARLQEERATLCAVLDEYGQLEGVVTVEDIVEEIVGEIWDEDDTPRGVRRLTDGGIVVRGDTPLVDLEDEGIHLESEHAESVGGIIQEHLGDIPKSGDRVTVGGRELRVLSTDRNRVKRVLIGPRRDGR
jgi:CBS domain containing-hemolysin-like protein